jgi:uncharacterized repeat protein (TIGR02543 family)
MKQIKVDLMRWMRSKYRKIIYPFVVMTTLVALAVPMGTTVLAATTTSLTPNAAGSQTNISNEYPNSSNHYSDCAANDGNTSYVYSSQGDQNYDGDLYNLTALSPLPSGTITSVTVHMWLRTGGSTPTQASAEALLRVGTTTVTGTAFQLTMTGWNDYSTTFTGRPGGGSWAWTDIDSLQAGVAVRRCQNTSGGDPVRTYCTQVYAVVNYNPPTYALTMAKSPSVGGTATDTTGGSPYTSGTIVNISASPATGYHFVNWSASPSSGTFGSTTSASTTYTMPGQAETVTANFAINTYTITWMNGATQLEQDTNVPYGTTPEYNGATPTKAADAQYTYTFSGWSPAIADVSGDQTYTATFSSVVNNYTITWMNGATQLEQDTNVPYGTTPEYNGATPTKAADAQYTYTFSGWSPAIADVSGDQTYNATFSSEINSYTVTFKDWDGTTLDTQSVEYGAAATAPADPTRTGYTFTGWDKAFTNITANLDVTAQYSLIPLVFNSGLNGDGNPLDGSLEDGFVIETSNLHSMHVLMLDDPTADPSLADGDYEFKLQADPEQQATLVSYFAVKAGWTDEMKARIGLEINGSEPFFFLRAEGGIYTLVDSFKAHFGSPDTSLTIDDDYPAGLYEYVGTLTASNGATLEVKVKLEVAPSNLIFDTGLKSDGVPLPGSLATEFTITITNSDTMHKLELDNPKANPNLKDGDYAFKLDADEDQQTALVSYFDAKAGWTIDMKNRIKAEIDGSIPFFYLRASGGVYSLVDNFKLWLGSPDTSLTIDDDYLAGTYEYNGTLVGTNDANLAITVKLIVPAVSYTITFDSNGGTHVNSITAEYRAPLMAPDDPTRLGYTFGGWDPDFPATMPLNGANLVAKWTQDEYTLNIEIVGGGSVDKSPDQATYHHGDVVSLTAKPDAGWTFGGFSGDTTTSSITMNGNRSVTATFNQQTKLVIITDPWTFTAGGVSGLITVQLQNATTGAPIKPSTNTVIDLSSSAASGKFAVNANGTPIITSNKVTIFAGTSTASFYYTDTVADPDPTIMVSNAALGSDSQTEIVQPLAAPAVKLVFTAIPVSVKAGKVSSLITVQVQDASGKAVKAKTNAVLTLSGGSFYANANGSTSITTATVFGGTSTASFYLKAPGSTGTVTITVFGTVNGVPVSVSQDITIN